jgi:TonB family protein
MALRKCRECGGQVSTEAKNCPHCGAPVASSGGKMLLAGLGAVVAIALVTAIAGHPGGSGSTPAAAASAPPAVAQSASAPAQTASAIAEASQPAPVAAPTGAIEHASLPSPSASLPKLPPLYSLAQGNGIYGYERAVSDDDRAKGILTKPLFMVRLQAMSDRQLSFIGDEGTGAASLFRCDWPCAFVKVTGADGETATLRAVPGSIAWSVVEDAKNGYLTVPGTGGSQSAARTALGVLEGQPSEGQYSPSGGPARTYGPLLAALIRQNTIYTQSQIDQISGNPRVTLLVSLDPNSGDVLGVSVKQSSGVPSWDQAVVRAVKRLGKVPSDHGRFWTPIEIVDGPRDFPQVPAEGTSPSGQAKAIQGGMPTTVPSAPASAAASAPLPSGPSFACARAFYPDEKAICANPALSALDRQTADLFERAAAASGDPAAFRKGNVKYVVERRTCGANVGCITDWYLRRQAALRQVLVKASR